MITALIVLVIGFLFASWLSVGREVETNLANHESPGVAPSGAGCGWGILSIVLFLFALVGLLAIVGGK